MLAASFGGSDRAWISGDFNGDGVVNLTDFNILAGNFGLSASGPNVTPGDWAALAAVVPEPGVPAAVTGMLGILAGRLLRRSRR